MKRQSQSGSAHLIVIIVLVTVILSLLGFVFWQNFMQPKSDITKTDITKTTDTSSDKTSEKTSAGSTQSTKGYLVLNDWGVKFKLPADLGDNQVTYTKGSSYRTEEAYTLSTSNVKALGGGCENEGLVVVFRQESPFASSELYPNSPIVQAGVVSQYNYYADPVQLGCSEGNNDALQVHDRDILTDLAKTIVAT